MGYEATFDGGKLIIGPPLGHKAIKEWQAKHRADHSTGHFCSIVLDITEDKVDTEEGELVRRHAAMAHIYDGGELRADCVLDDINDLIIFANRQDATVSGVIQQTEGHPDENYPHRWIVRDGGVDVQKPMLIYPEDPGAISVLAGCVTRETGPRGASHDWTSEEAISVATGMVRALTNK